MIGRVWEWIIKKSFKSKEREVEIGVYGVRDVGSYVKGKVM